MIAPFFTRILTKLCFEQITAHQKAKKTILVYEIFGLRSRLL